MILNNFLEIPKEDLLKYFLKNKEKYIYKTDQKEKLPSYTEAIITRNRCPFPREKFYKNPLVWSFNSIINQTYLPEEIILLSDSDAAPKDYTEEIVQMFRKQCEEKNISFVYQKNSEQKNLAEARNIALKISKNNLIHYIDDDCILYAEAMSSAVALFEKVKNIDDKIAILNMPQASRSSHPIKVASVEKMSKINLESLELTGGVSATFPLEYLSSPEYFGKSKNILKPLILENFQAGNMLLDRDIVLTQGGFVDYKAIISYAEDGGLIAALKKNGFKVYYFPYLNMHAVHMSFGNSGGLQEFFGEDWLDKGKEKEYNLKQMVQESVVFREGSGCRVRKEIYFYVKIRNFFLMLEDFKTGLGEKWMIKSYEDFVVKNKIEFQDKKGITENMEMRNKIWEKAISDAKNKISFKSIEEFLLFFNLK